MPSTIASPRSLRERTPVTKVTPQRTAIARNMPCWNDRQWATAYATIPTREANQNRTLLKWTLGMAAVR